MDILSSLQGPIPSIPRGSQESLPPKDPRKDPKSRSLKGVPTKKVPEGSLRSRVPWPQKG